MILAIRIHGLVEIDETIENALFRLRMRRKYSATLLLPTKQNLALLKKIRNFIAYGPINDKSLLALIEKRAQLIDKNKKINASQVVNEILSQEKKGKLDLNALNLKSFFRLHPPRKGIDAKIHFGRKKGVLGDNGDKINDLLGRML